MKTIIKRALARVRRTPTTALALGRLNKALVNLKAVSEHHIAESDRKTTRAKALEYQAISHNAEASKALRIHDKLTDLLS